MFFSAPQRLCGSVLLKGSTNMKQKHGMVDISEKNITKRIAIATSIVKFSKKTFTSFIKEGSPKGDVLESAKIAGIMAAKSTPAIIPMCHPIALNKVKITFKVDIPFYKSPIKVVVMFNNKRIKEIELPETKNEWKTIKIALGQTAGTKSGILSFMVNRLSTIRIPGGVRRKKVGFALAEIKTY